MGCFVDMKKSCMFSKQIRSGTISESKDTHSKLFDAVKKSCAEVARKEGDFDETIAETTPEEFGLKQPEKIAEACENIKEALTKALPVVIRIARGLVVGTDPLTVVAGALALLLFGYILFVQPSVTISSPVVATDSALRDLSMKVDIMSEEVKELKRMLQRAFDTREEPRNGC